MIAFFTIAFKVGPTIVQDMAFLTTRTILGSLYFNFDQFTASFQCVQHLFYQRDFDIELFA